MQATELGSVMVGIAGATLSDADREMLQHPAVGGVVLFSRNYKNREQLLDLTAAIRALRMPRLLIAIDQEGGRVQRLKKDFTILPAPGTLGRVYATDASKAVEYAYRHARVMAFEILSVNIDLSFAPVLDLNRASGVIGDRSLGADPTAVIDLGRAYIQGMQDAGMCATGKHFPGHGSVKADSHIMDVIDDRSLEQLMKADAMPFASLAARLDAMMIAHVTYPQVDQNPAGFSSVWLQDILRNELDYTGTIISDDLDMEAARGAGNMPNRVAAALNAGCDCVLVCNPESARSCLQLMGEPVLASGSRLAQLYGRPEEQAEQLQSVADWNRWRISLEKLIA